MLFIDRLKWEIVLDEAAMFARKQFIDYDIDAPLINGLDIHYSIL